MLIKKIRPQTSRRIFTKSTRTLNRYEIRLQQIHHNLIVQNWPKVFNGLVIAGRMDAVGQQDDGNRTIEIHPKRGSSETKMPHTVGRKIVAGT